MLRSTLLVAISALSALVTAQNYSTSGELSVDISQIEPALLQTWCNAQITSCPDICGSRAYPNSCIASTLNWTCTCSSGAQPNISDYENTIPSYVCAQWRINCVANHPMDLVGQTACLSVVCGSKNPMSNVNTTTAAASSTASSTSAASSSSTPAASTTDSGSAAATSSGAAAVIHVAQQYGTGFIATGLLALFGLAL